MVPGGRVVAHPKRCEAVSGIEGTQRFTVSVALGLCPRSCEVEVRPDGDAPSLNVGGTEVLLQSVAFAGKQGDLTSFIEVIRSGSSIVVPGRKMGAHKMQEPNHLGA